MKLHAVVLGTLLGCCALHAPAWGQGDPLSPDAPPAVGAPEAAPPPSSRRSTSKKRKRERDWELSLQPALTLPLHTDGEVTTDGIETPANGSLDSNLSGWLLDTRVELWSPFRFGLVLNGVYGKLEIDHRSQQIVPPAGGVAPSGVATETQVRLGSVDALLGFRFFDGVSLLKVCRIDLFLFGGGRFMTIRNELSGVTAAGNSVSISSRAHWGEFLFGAQAGVSVFDDALAALARFDVGGYGIGSSADLDWSFYFAVRWRPSERISVELGYLFHDLDFAHGSGPSKTALQLQLHGPRLGVGIHF